jgi:lysophospholipase L1-like esterase
MRRLFSVALVFLVGCSSGTQQANNGDDGGGAAGDDAGSNPGPGPSGPLVPSGETLGTYIALGDSITDRGGVGPFFYDGLKDDLTRKYPGLTYVHGGKASAITDVYASGKGNGRPTLKAQIALLTSAYPGNVLVSITIGGNDLQAHSVEAIQDAQDSKNRLGPVKEELKQHLDAELGELLTPGRLGSGKVYVVLANVYDFTDGQGNFGKLGCPPYANVRPEFEKAAFADWNAVIAKSVSDAKATLYDMHANFDGKGLNFKPDTWYHTDCIHPNAAGHEAIRKSLYKIVTGESL